MGSSVILGTGSYLPQNVVTNDDLAKRVDTTHEWIFSRTGIKQRHIAAEDESSASIGAQAAKRALENAGVQADDVDLIIVATTTPEKTFPSTAVSIQAALGVTKGAAFDVQAVCAGFVYALTVADSLIQAGQAKTALVIGADCMSRIIDWEDRGTCVLFGDGAGAVVLRHDDQEDVGVQASYIAADGRYTDILYTDGGVSSTGTSGKLRMLGKDVYRHAVEKMSDSLVQVMERLSLSVEAVDYLIPHQANVRILDAVGQRLQIDTNKVVTTVSHHANTSAASIPLALDHLAQQGDLRAGQTIALVALGGGLCWGASVINWSKG